MHSTKKVWFAVRAVSGETTHERACVRRDPCVNSRGTRPPTCACACGEYLLGIPPKYLPPALGRSWLVAPHHWLASSEDPASESNSKGSRGVSIMKSFIDGAACTCGMWMWWALVVPVKRGEVNGERVKCRDGKYCQGTGAASEVTESFGYKHGTPTGAQSRHRVPHCSALGSYMYRPPSVLSTSCRAHLLELVSSCSRWGRSPAAHGYVPRP